MLGVGDHGGHREDGLDPLLSGSSELLAKFLGTAQAREGIGEGEITSGGFSPTMGKSIALARVPAGDYDRATVEVRGKLLNVRIVKTPFVRNGQIRIDI